MSTFRVADGVHGIDVELFDEGVVSGYLFDGEAPTLVDPGTFENLVLSHARLDHAGAGARSSRRFPTSTSTSTPRRRRT